MSNMGWRKGRPKEQALKKTSQGKHTGVLENQTTNEEAQKSFLYTHFLAVVADAIHTTWCILVTDIHLCVLMKF